MANLGVYASKYGNLSGMSDKLLGRFLNMETLPVGPVAWYVNENDKGEPQYCLNGDFYLKNMPV